MLQPPGSPNRLKAAYSLSSRAAFALINLLNGIRIHLRQLLLMWLQLKNYFSADAQPQHTSPDAKKQHFSDTSWEMLYTIIRRVSLANRYFINIHEHRVGLWMPWALFLQLNHSRLKHDCHNIHNVEYPSLKSQLNIHEFTYPERGPANSCTLKQQTAA